MKVKTKILICTGLMLNDHSNPYIESTTVLINLTVNGIRTVITHCGVIIMTDCFEGAKLSIYRSRNC